MTTHEEKPCLLCRKRKRWSGGVVCKTCYEDGFGPVESYARLLGSAGGRATAAALTKSQRQAKASKGGRASAAALTPEQRKERARRAIAARWAKRDAGKSK